MELQPGICNICHLNSNVLNSTDSKMFWELGAKIFEEDFKNLTDDVSDLKICPTCIFQISLIESQEESIRQAISKEDAEVAEEKCRICKTSSEIFKIQNLNLLKIFSGTLDENGWFMICARCYYIVEAKFNLRNSLIKRKLCNIKGETSISNGASTKRIKKKIKSKKRISKDNSKSIDSPSTEANNKRARRSRSETSDTPSPNSLIHNNGQSSAHVMETSDEKFEVTDSTLQSTPRLRTRNRNHLNDNETSFSCCEGQTNDSSTVVSQQNQYTPKSRKRKASRSPEAGVSSQTKRTRITQTNSKVGLNFSLFEPLADSKINISEEVKEDTKFYKCIPFVKLSQFEDDQSKPDISHQNVLSNIFKKRNKLETNDSSSSSKRTPPIKIKLKPEVKIKHKREPTIKKRRSERNEAHSPALIEEIHKKQVVVKLARMELRPVRKMETETIEDEINKNIETLFEPETKIDITNEVPPKKKKKVHFNDTPTIIITEDEFSEEEYHKYHRNRGNDSAIRHLNDTKEEINDSEEDTVEISDDVEISEEENINIGNEINCSAIEHLNDTEGKINAGEEDSVEISDDVKVSKEENVKDRRNSSNCTKKITDDSEERIEINNDVEDEMIDKDETSSVEVDKKTKTSEDEENPEIKSPTNASDGSNIGSKEIEKESADSVDGATIDGRGEESNVSIETNDEHNKLEHVKNGCDKSNKTLDEKDTKTENNKKSGDSSDELEAEVEDKSSKKSDDELNEKNNEDDSCKDNNDEFSENTEMEIPENYSDSNEKKIDDDNSNDGVVVNDINLSAATGVNEDFGTLIDEVKKCLESSKDLSNKSEDEPILELNDTADIDKDCLADANRGLEDFKEALLEDDKDINLEAVNDDAEDIISKTSLDETSAEQRVDVQDPVVEINSK